MLLEYLNVFLLPVLTAFLGWFGSKWQTKREKKRSDIELIDKAIMPLVESISNLTGHIEKLTTDLIAQKSMNVKLLSEKITLEGRVSDLKKRIETLSGVVEKTKV